MILKFYSQYRNESVYPDITIPEFKYFFLIRLASVCQVLQYPFLSHDFFCDSAICYC